MATDTFGRGIDVERVNIVVDCNAPPDADPYFDRAGEPLERIKSIRPFSEDPFQSCQSVRHQKPGDYLRVFGG